jgi:hypothetical protein
VPALAKRSANPSANGDGRASAVAPLDLSRADLDNLRASGLSDDTIRANGLRTERDPQELARILNRPVPYRTKGPAGEPGSEVKRTFLSAGGLVIPYRDLQGEVNCFARVRPHAPRPDKKGRPVKYEQPLKEPCRAYYPSASLPKLNDGTSPVYVTEGEKKALALSQLGLAAVGIGGVWSWKPKDTDDLIPDLAAVPWAGRVVYVVFDYDPKPDTRNNVHAARKRLARALLKAGAAAVRSVELPPGPDGAKQGVDDFLVAHGPVVFGDLVARAGRVVGPPGEPGNEIISVIPLRPPTLEPDAYHGLVGQFLRAVAPHTEATDAGVLAHLLPAIGTLAGPGPHYWAGGRQPPRLHLVLVGRTSTGRKGTSFAPVDLLMQRVAPEFWAQQKRTGLSSGEGLIVAVADRVSRDEDGNEVIEPVEKRLFVYEPEFANVFAQMKRDGNVLSGVLREAWESGDLGTMTIVPRQAYGAHISVVGHITPAELEARLNHVDMANGFGNRFLWFMVESEKILPKTQPIPGSVFEPFVKRLRTLMTFGRRMHACRMDAPAGKLWDEVYGTELRPEGPGIAGQMTSRGAPMVLRVALIYALTDCVRPEDLFIKEAHLRAGLAVWRYCRASAEYLFTSETDDPLKDKLLKLLDKQPMTRNEFNRHLSPGQKRRVDEKLTELEKDRLIESVVAKHDGPGRPAIRWQRTAEGRDN